MKIFSNDDQKQTKEKFTDSLYPQFPSFTPHMRVVTRGEESILSNLANGKWVRINNLVLKCLAYSNLSEMISSLESSGVGKQDAENFLGTLAEYDFIDVGQGHAFPKKLQFQLSTAYLNVTDFCNLACRHCYFGSHSGLTHGLANEYLFKMIDNIRLSGIQFLVIAGGEPLTLPGIKELLICAKNKQFRDITLLTNGTIITQDLAETIVACVDNIHVSLDGPDEKVNAKLRGKGNFTKTIEGIRILKTVGAKKIRLITTVNSANINRMNEMRKLKENLDVELGTTIFSKVGRGNKCSSLTPRKNDLIKFFSEEVSSVVCNSSNTGNASLDISAGTTCGSGVLMVSIDCRGDVFPCHLLHRPEFKIGNILVQPNLIQMLQDSDVAKLFSKRTVEDRKCHGCEVEYFCKGGCLAHTIAANSKSADPWKEKDPFCAVHRAILGAQLWNTALK